MKVSDFITGDVVKRKDGSWAVYLEGGKRQSSDNKENLFINLTTGRYLVAESYKEGLTRNSTSSYNILEVWRPRFGYSGEFLKPEFTVATIDKTFVKIFFIEDDSWVEDVD